MIAAHRTNLNDTPLKEDNLCLEDSEAELDETPFNLQYILENHTIQWGNLPLVQQLFENAPFDESLHSLTP